MKKIVISAVNLVDGGTFSILSDLISNINFSADINYYVLVNSKSLFVGGDIPSNVIFKEYPKVKSSWVRRIYFEYIQSKKIAMDLSADFWLSLHDISPSLPKGLPSAVYCHNPTPFAKIRLIDVFYDPKYFLFTLFYRYLYKININNNRYVFVQQQWLAREFSKFVKENKIVVAKPNTILSGCQVNTVKNNTVFVYPSYPRPFKNFEVLLKAVDILEKRKLNDFTVFLTIDGSENLYTKTLCRKYKHLKSVVFLGRVSRDKVKDLFKNSGTLVFPSKLETWGLPITEAKEFGLSLLVADLPYAKETVGSYDDVCFFDCDCPFELAKLMSDRINDDIEFHGNRSPKSDFKSIYGWDSFIKLLCK